MGFEFTNLNIKRVIVHEIFPKDLAMERGNEPEYSTEIMNFDKKGLTELNKRIMETMGRDSSSMEMDINIIDNSSTFSLFSNLITSRNPEFITVSQNIAKNLQRAITSRIMKGGILAVIDGTVGKRNFDFGMTIKSEITSGFLRNRDKRKISLEFFDNLTLTTQHKLYQIGAFIYNKPQQDKYDAKNYISYIYDHRLQKAEERPSVQYFYENFLGCKISPSGKVLTRKFYDHVREFNKEHFVGAELLDQNSALITRLKVSQKDTLKLEDYAKDVYPKELRDEFLSHMGDKGLPRTAFDRDITYIKRKLRRRSIQFNSNVKIVAPADDFDKIVDIDGYDEKSGFTKLSIKGKIEQEK